MTEQLYQKILVAADGSERNMAAVAEAIRIARICGAGIVAAYVQDLSALESVPPGEMVLRDTWGVIQEEGQATMYRIRSLAEGVALQTVLLEGKPAAEIVRYAEKNGIDLIVIGTQGKRGLERLLLGSVAESIIRSAPCRVLVVK